MYMFIDNFSVLGQILFFIALLLILMNFFKRLHGRTEGFTNSGKFEFKSSPELYDEFYVSIYDMLVYNETKNKYEIAELIKVADLNNAASVLDVGCGTGHHVALLQDKGISATGLDVSKAMIKKAAKQYPECDFQVGDALNLHEFQNNSFTHIFCMYFTVYYFKDKKRFFKNCMEWLRPGGYLVVHLVDRDDFDPILPPGNPLYIVSPQKYAKERITHTNVKFNNFAYKSNFKLDGDVAKFEETFKFNDGARRKQEHVMYMDELDDILGEAQSCGFVIDNKIELVRCAYEHQYLFILQKAN
jgi:SAM-dependent methyltransferase